MEKMTAQAVFDKAFQPGRTPRSDAYRQGVLACLQVRLDGLEHVQRPYEEGTAEFDAYFFGVNEGRDLSPLGTAPAGFIGHIVMEF